MTTAQQSEMITIQAKEIPERIQRHVLIAFQRLHILID